MNIGLKDKSYKILRKIYGTLSLTSALFVFQACYGTPGDYGNDTLIEGVVKAKSTHLPVSGIKILIENLPQYEVTDASGKFAIYVPHSTQYKIRFEDTNTANNRIIVPKDTVLAIKETKTAIEVFLDVK